MRETLRSLAKANQQAIAVEVIVVDNGSEDDTQCVAESFRDSFPVTYFREERRGKCHALNRALDANLSGAIVAFLDDDLTVDSDWFRGVIAICGRWPDHDVFTGRSYVAFPEGEDIPGWAGWKECHAWAFSVLDRGPQDKEFERGFFPSGNHFWVRSRVLNLSRFAEQWLTSEPGFTLGLADAGCRGAYGPDAVVWHRIQPPLLTRETILKRMVLFGREMPYVRLPYANVFWQSRVFRKYPLVYVGLCGANLSRWLAKYLLALCRLDSDRRFVGRAWAAQCISANLETVLHWRRIRRACTELEGSRSSIPAKSIHH